MHRWLGILAGVALTACSGRAPALPAAPDAASEGVPAAEAQVDDNWSVAPRAVRFEPDTRTLFVEAELTAPEDREAPVHVGVTAVTTDGREIDLMVQSLQTGALDAPVIFSADLDADVEAVLIGAWDRKIAPCDVDRHGCREFGFVLDGSLATWPPDLYAGGLRQRIPPDVYRARVAGGTPEQREATVDALHDALSVFGSDVEASLSADVPEGVDLAGAEIRHAHPQDALLADRVAAALGGDVTVVHAPDLGADMVVVIGG